MNGAALITGALLCMLSSIALLGLLIVAMRIVRQVKRRRKDRRADPVRSLLLELVCEDEDEDEVADEGGESVGALSRLVALDDRTWAAIEPTATAMLGKVSGKGRASLVDLFRQRGAAARAQKDLGSRSAVRRARAAEMLGNLDQWEATPALQPLLEDHDPEVRTVAARALGRMGEPAVVSPLLESLWGPRSVPPPVVTLALIRCGPDALPAIAAGLRHTHPLVRAVAIEVLGVTAGVAWTQDVATALACDPSLEVRIRAARALGMLGMPSGLRPLQDALSARQPVALRTVAARALGRLGAVTAAPRLGALLSDPSHRVASAAAESLLRLGPAGRTVLDRAAKSPSGDRAGEQARAALAADALEAQKLLPTSARYTNAPS